MMRRFRKGMVFTTDLDLEPDALAPAVDGSIRHGTSVTVAAAVSPRRWLTRRVIPGLSEQQLVDAVVSDTQDRLEKIAEPFRSAGLETSTEVLVGDPVVEVVRAVVRGAHRLEAWISVSCVPCRRRCGSFVPFAAARPGAFLRPWNTTLPSPGTRS
jgi:hypothetical protein